MKNFTINQQKELLGKKWSDISMDTRNALLTNANIRQGLGRVENNTITLRECIVYFTEHLSISAKIIASELGDLKISISENDTIYSPTRLCNVNVDTESEKMLQSDLIDEIKGCINELKGVLSYETIDLINKTFDHANDKDLYNLCNSLRFISNCDADYIGIINTLVQADEINHIAFLDIEYHINEYLSDYTFYNMSLSEFATYHLTINDEIPSYIKPLIDFDKYKGMLSEYGIIVSDFGILYQD